MSSAKQYVEVRSGSSFRESYTASQGIYIVAESTVMSVAWLADAVWNNSAASLSWVIMMIIILI
jgi:hypothetical protein